MTTATRRGPLRTSLPLWLEITLILVIKVFLLWGAWKLWFSAPLAHHMQVPQSAISQQLLGVAASAPVSSHQPSGDKQ
ncbi:cytochrome oxidase putative small subunit CydP [Andreprevotia chitinilytica]|uniref:cytochrome oxidase putative small subunit CydP n=1 Tax=Andreprevotia chitinilytica TaxID=396808 RepID=UPI00054E4A28|nr:cytochrome oxidase putative small subunit CydP [Andreprevotia chitinilytica]